jgi:hypothetical protein
MRKLKVFGLALVAALSLSAVAAGAASATYDSEVEHVTLKGEQVGVNVLTTDTGTEKCEVAKFEGTQLGTQLAANSFTAAEIVLHPTYSKCKAFGLNATVSTTGCDFRFATATTTEGTYNAHAKFHIDCTAGNQIVKNGGLGTCILKIKAQTAEGVVDFENKEAGSSRDLLLNWTITGIHYVSSGACEAGGEVTKTNGTLSGEVTIKGFNTEGVQKGIWVT